MKNEGCLDHRIRFEEKLSYYCVNKRSITSTFIIRKPSEEEVFNHLISTMQNKIDLQNNLM